MTTVRLGAALLLGCILLSIRVERLLASQENATSRKNEKQVIFLLPEGFRGWVCTDFNVVGAPLLPVEGDAEIIRPRRGEILNTSDRLQESFFHAQTWFEINGQRQRVPDDLSLYKQQSRHEWPDSVERGCAFFGSKQEADAAGDPPGSHESARGVSPEERRALVALYQSTDGNHWKNHDGWLGPLGTECTWYGISCNPTFHEPTTVTEIELSENNLVGSLPEEIGQLTNIEDFSTHSNNLSGPVPAQIGKWSHLDRLIITGNHFSGMLSDPLIRRWLAGGLYIAAEAPRLTDVSEIDYEISSSSVLCARHRIILRADGRATLYTDRCRNATPGDRFTFCEVKEGHVGGPGFGRLARLIEQNGFFSLKHDYDYNVTDATLQSTRVTRQGNGYEVVNYATPGPFELWVIQCSIEGVAASVEWEKITKQAEYPQWRKSHASGKK
jgi:hypothetical protein